MLTKEEFDALSDRDKRIAIAKDAREEWMRGGFAVARGSWLRADSDVTWTQEELCSGRVVCHGCALGGAIYSLIRLGNDFRCGASDYIGLEDFYNRLAAIFPPEQIQKIEVAFELGQGRFTEEYFDVVDMATPDWFNAAVDFGERYLKADHRFAAIMQNIEEHGKFVP